MVEPVEQLANRLVGFFQREELAVAKCCNDPALGNLHGTFHDRFVPRFVRPRRQYAETVVHGEVVIRRVDIRIVAVGFAHARPGIVGNCQRRNAAPIIESMHVRAQPRFHLLVACGLGPGVGTGAEGGDEKRCLPGYTGNAIVNGDCGTSPVDESLLAGFVLLPHHHVEFLAPALVQLAESAVAIALRVGFAVLLPKQLQGHVAVSAKLLVDRGEVRR